MAEREKESNRDWTSAFLHQLACDIVDSCDVIGVEGVAQPEAIGEESHTEQQRLTMELDQRPQPSADIADDEERVDAAHIATHALGGVVKKLRKHESTHFVNLHINEMK